MPIAEDRIGRGVLRRGYNPKGVVIHNDAGPNGATKEVYDQYLRTAVLENGFAHYYVTSTGTLKVADETSIAWHTADYRGNHDFIGIEACQSTGDLEQFKRNEENSLKLAAEILKRYGLPANRSTVVLHKQFVATSCPHRSVALHGDYTAVQDYFIARIKAYMGQGTSKPNYKPAPQKPDKSAIGQLKAFGGSYTAYKTFKVDEIENVNGMWQAINYGLAGGKNFSWTNNGIPLAVVDNVTRGNQKATQIGDSIRFSSAYNHGTVDAYDTPSNGIMIKMGSYGPVWFNADKFLDL